MVRMSADSGPEWEEYRLGSDDEEKSESEAEEDGSNDHMYLRDDDKKFLYEDGKE